MLTRCYEISLQIKFVMFFFCLCRSIWLTIVNYWVAYIVVYYIDNMDGGAEQEQIVDAKAKTFILKLNK